MASLLLVVITLPKDNILGSILGRKLTQMHRRGIEITPCQAGKRELDSDRSERTDQMFGQFVTKGQGLDRQTHDCYTRCCGSLGEQH